VFQSRSLYIGSGVSPVILVILTLTHESNMLADFYLLQFIFRYVSKEKDCRDVVLGNKWSIYS